MVLGLVTDKTENFRLEMAGKTDAQQKRSS